MLECMDLRFYFYVPALLADEILECGLKLNDWSDREAIIHGTSVKCMTAYIHPADGAAAMPGIDGKGSVLLRFTVPAQYAFVAEGSLRGNREAYDRTITSAEQYEIGSYRNPQGLITCTVLPGMIERHDRRMGEAVFYESSEQFYMDRLFLGTDEQYPDFRDTALAAFYSRLAAQGGYQIIRSDEYTVYENDENHKIVVVRTGKDCDTIGKRGESR